MSQRSKSPCGSKSRRGSKNVPQVASSGGNPSGTVVEKDKHSPSFAKLVIWVLLILAGNTSFFGKYVQENIWGFGMFIGALFLFLPFKADMVDNKKNIPLKVEDKFVRCCWCCCDHFSHTALDSEHTYGGISGCIKTCTGCNCVNGKYCKDKQNFEEANNNNNKNYYEQSSIYTGYMVQPF